MWRPKNPYTSPVREGVTWNIEVILAWELGFDTCLEALKKEAWNYITEGHHETLTDDGYISWDVETTGWVVFIPEDKDLPPPLPPEGPDVIIEKEYPRG